MKNDSQAADKYRTLAARYDSRWARYIEITYRATAERLALEGNERVLDVGCGTGAMLGWLAAENPSLELHGVDACAEMLDVARERLAGAAQIDTADATALPHDDASFDLVMSCNMFHYIADPVSALREMSRVLRPGGRLVITDWCDDFLACKACDLFLRVVSRAHHQTYAARDCREMIESAGFERTQVDRYKITWLWGLMTATAHKES